MPITRGTARAVIDGRSDAGVVITSQTWNAVYPTCAIIPVRSAVSPIEAPHSVQLSGGGFAVACDLLNVFQPPDPRSPLGPQLFVLPLDELAELENRLCLFLQLPRLLGPRLMKPRQAPSSTPYPFWSEVYFGATPVKGQLKRRIVVSPDPWNAVSGRVTWIRTTTQQKTDYPAFPVIQNGAAQAACGDMTTVPTADVLQDPQRRPQPSATTLNDMVAIATALTFTHDLAAAVARNPSP